VEGRGLTPGEAVISCLAILPKAPKRTAAVKNKNEPASAEVLEPAEKTAPVSEKSSEGFGKWM